MKERAGQDNSTWREDSEHDCELFLFAPPIAVSTAVRVEDLEPQMQAFIEGSAVVPEFEAWIKRYGLPAEQRTGQVTCDHYVHRHGQFKKFLHVASNEPSTELFPACLGRVSVCLLWRQRLV